MILFLKDQQGKEIKAEALKEMSLEPPPQVCQLAIIINCFATDFSAITSSRKWFSVAVILLPWLLLARSAGIRSQMP
jgi:hypothetical protein